jgi:hypothetical protein
MAADLVIRRTTAGAIAGAAAMASCEHAHAHALARAYGEAGRTGRPVPLTMDGLIYVTSIVMRCGIRRAVAQAVRHVGRNRFGDPLSRQLHC